MDDRNPYASPQSLTADTLPTTDVGDRPSRRIYLVWTIVFVLNLAVPLLIAWNVSNDSGGLGMFAAIAALYLLGSWICAKHCRHLGVGLIAGGLCVGLTQVFPLLQIMAGSVGFAIATRLGQVDGRNGDLPDVNSAIGGFIITMTTGVLLMAAALVIGLPFQAIASRRKRSKDLKYAKPKPIGPPGSVGAQVRS
jgi:hypothetical protein